MCLGVHSSCGVGIIGFISIMSNIGTARSLLVDGDGRADGIEVHLICEGFAVGGWRHVIVIRGGVGYDAVVPGRDERVATEAAAARAVAAVGAVTAATIASVVDIIIGILLFRELLGDGTIKLAQRKASAVHQGCPLLAEYHDML